MNAAQLTELWLSLVKIYGEEQARITWQSDPQLRHVTPPGTSTLERIAATPHEFTRAPSTRVHDAVMFRSYPGAWLKQASDVQRFPSESATWPNEEALQWAIIKRFRLQKTLAFVLDAGSKSQTAKAKAGRTPPGFPDIWVMSRGVTMHLEVKLPGQGAFTDAQLEFIPTLVEHGAIVHIVHSCFEAWHAVLEHIGDRNART
jgi:hypothetical protein